MRIGRAGQVTLIAVGLGTRYVPFVVWRRAPYRSAGINVDADGFRTHTLGRDNDPGAVSTGFFGGSAMWGTGVDDDETIPAIFDQLTRGYAVTNYGESGHNSRQGLEQLVNLANQNRGPKVVVLYTGHNDVAVACNPAVSPSVNGHGQEARIRDALAEARGGTALYLLLVAPVTRPLAQVRRALGGGDRARACDRDPGRAEAVAETMIRNWEIARAVAAAYGGQVHAFLQPSAYQGRPRVDHLRGYPDRWFGAQIAAVYPLMKRKMEQRGAGWMTDLTAIFDGDEHIYIDGVHVSRDGNRRLAERMRDRLADASTLP